MRTKTILKPIWNWQITIPQEWRILLWIDMEYVSAEFEWDRIIIKPIDKKKWWDVSKISLNKLKDENVDLIKKWEKSYLEWNFDDFLDHEDFWWKI